MKHDSFCIFILSHGRADNVITMKTLKRCGYTGDVVIVCDDEDDQLAEYEKKFPRVEVFSKSKVKCDTMDLTGSDKVILFARVQTALIAEKLGYKYFLELDDDYTSFQIRHPVDGRLRGHEVKNLDNVIDAYLDFMDNTPTTTIAFAQGGDFIGGLGNGAMWKPKRKAMNAFFCDTERPFQFLGRINEDVNMYLLEGMRGNLIFTLLMGGVMLTQKETQKNEGGMTGTYLDKGTYIKSFYSVMINPSAVKISMMGDKHLRIHHHINWRYAVPKILDEEYKK
jgi:hypothetical protein